MQKSIHNRKYSTLPPLMNPGFYARYLARQMGYELVGEGGKWQHLLGYRLFPRKLPDSITKEFQDPYLTPLRININSISSRVGFSYSEDGWHPFVQTLKEYEQDAALCYEGSTLAKLYSQFCPSNAQEVLLEHIPYPLEPFCGWPPAYELVSWVWTLNQYSVQSHLNRSIRKSMYNGWIFFGPHTQEYGRREFQRLTGVYESIKRNGYQSGLAGTDPVNGYFLKDGDTVRFVLLQGNHRVSALKAAGYSHVDVLIRPGHPAVVDRTDLHKWTITGGGIYPEATVECLFEALLNESGLKKARRLSLID